MRDEIAKMSDDELLKEYSNRLAACGVVFDNPESFAKVFADQFAARAEILRRMELGARYEELNDER